MFVQSLIRVLLPTDNEEPSWHAEETYWLADGRVHSLIMVSLPADKNEPSWHAEETESTAGYTKVVLDV